MTLTSEQWDVLKDCVIVLLAGIISYIVSWKVSKGVANIKNPPSFPIYFKIRNIYIDKTTPDPEKDEDWMVKNQKILLNAPDNPILNIQPPMTKDNVYSTSKYCWFASIPSDNNDFIRLNVDYSTRELNYDWADREGVYLGPWFPEAHQGAEIIFQPKNIEKCGKAWWIFYFTDNYKFKNHCYCLKFSFEGDNWEPIGEQKRNHYRTLKDNGDWACLRCPFKKFIKHYRNNGGRI